MRDHLKNKITALVLLSILFVLCLPSSGLAQLYNIRSLEGSSGTSYAIRNDGTLLSWGNNEYGQLGLGSLTWRTNLPALVYDIRDVKTVDSDWIHALALKTDGTVWGWGDNCFGQLGTGSSGGNCGTSQCTPIQVKDPTDPSGFMTDVAAVATTSQMSFFLKEDGSVWGAGINTQGQLGIGTTGGPGSAACAYGARSYYEPVRVKKNASEYLTDAIALTVSWAAVIVQKADGTVWGWGLNGYGQIGDGTTAARLYPVQVKKDASTPLTGVAAIKTAFYSTMALLGDGTVWTWGYNTRFTLGNSTSQSTVNLYPRQVEVQPGQYLTNIIAIDLGAYRAVALKADGTVWTWGWEDVGDGTTTGGRGRAVQVKTSATKYLEDVIAIKAGRSHTLALKSDGSVWGWGHNANGTVGVGNYTSPVLYAVPVQMPKILLSVTPPGRVSPGQRFTIPVFYQNIFNEILADVVIVVDIPRNFQYVSSTKDGIFWNEAEKHQVFWKLGNLGSLQRGDLSITLQVPWGLPDGITPVTGEIGARNLSSSINIDEYINYNPKKVVSEQQLTPAEITALLSSDTNLKALYDYALGLGYVFYDVAYQFQYNDGDTLTTFGLFDPAEGSLVHLQRVNDKVFLEKYHGDAYTRFDQNGGYTVDVNEGTINAWGAWAEDHSLKFFQCLFNCFGQKLPAWAIKKILGLGGAISMAQDYVKCRSSGGQDVTTCAKFLVKFYEVGIPILSPAIDFGHCFGECLGNPDKHICTKDLIRCGESTLGWLFGMDTVFVTKCDTLTGAYRLYDERILCGYGEKCSNGECISLRKIEYKGTFTSSSGVKTQNVQVVSRRDIVSMRAKDPNEKSVDYPGNVIPGQRLTYTISYENVGKGTAYSVFIMDKLDPNLDETTLTINNGGTYSNITRLLDWDIGELAPRGGGFVSFSVNVKNNVPHNTTIMNFANVHFPSAAEITPTNPVVHIVKTTVADAQTVETISVIPVSITLTGRDFYSRPLTYRIAQNPLNGTLSGTPPNIIYKPAPEFSGQDDVLFVVNNGTADSDPAKVTIKVNPDLSDTKPPEVVATYPVANAFGVPASNAPTSNNPLEYRPAITATFSEAVKPETINGNTFTVGGLSGTVYYDERLRTASFVPSAPLLPSMRYTAQLSTGIADMAGNPLVFYQWQFDTESLVNIAISLPDNESLVNFGKVFINTTSPGQTINVASTGNGSLVIQSMAFTGSASFMLMEDKCIGETLPRPQSCWIKVAFAPTAAGVSQGALEIRSNDPDASVASVPLKGMGVSATVDQDGDGYPSDVDCDDNDLFVYPGAPEICDGKDNNCNGQIDEGVQNTYYQDADGDGYGSPAISVQACTPSSGYVTNNSDCDDSNAAINPTTVWYKDVDNDRYSDGTTKTQCLRPAGYKLAGELIATSGDCGDTKASVNPGATEIPNNGIDDDCNSATPDVVGVTYRISGGAYFFPETTTFRASFSMDVTGPTSPSGWLKYYYTRTRMNFVSTGITAVSALGNTATISGIGTVNGVGGYTFTATVTNGSPDTFAIVIKKSDGTTYYSVGPKNISGGDLAIQ